MQKRLVLVVAIVVLIGGLCFAGGSAETGVVELKISHVLPTNEPIHEVLVEMADRIMARSDGSMIVQVYPNSELGNNKDNLEQVRRGANIITIADPGYVADYVPDYAIMNGPFLYRDHRGIAQLAETEWHQEMIEQSAEQAIKILAMDWYFGARHIISDREIRRPEDLRGMKVRVPPNIMWIETIRAMGGEPTTLQWSEVYSGLAQGVVDAAEAPLSTLYGSRLHETRKRIALTGHFVAIVGLQMSQQLFDSMTAEQQEILMDEVRWGGIEATRRVSESEAEWRRRLEAEGVVFNDVDKAAFEQSTSVVYTRFPEWTPGLYDRIQTSLR